MIATNIGLKIRNLKDSTGFKNFKEFGDFVGLPNDWLLELSKKEKVATIDVTRLQQIANKMNVTIDWLLADDETSDEVEIKQDLPDDDIAKMLLDVQKALNESSHFEGTKMQESTCKIAKDGIEILLNLIRQNL